MGELCPFQQGRLLVHSVSVRSLTCYRPTSLDRFYDVIFCSRTSRAASSRSAPSTGPVELELPCCCFRTFTTLRDSTQT